MNSISDSISFNEGLKTFLDQSVSPYHAVMTVSEALSDAGFVLLDEQAEWNLQGEKIFCGSWRKLYCRVYSWCNSIREVFVY